MTADRFLHDTGLPELIELRRLAIKLRSAGRFDEASTVFVALAVINVALERGNTMHRHFDKLLGEQYEHRYEPGYPCGGCYDSASEYGDMMGLATPPAVASRFLVGSVGDREIHAFRKSDDDPIDGDTHRLDLLDDGSFRVVKL